MSLKTIALRIGQAVLVIWATFTLSFILLAALPGDAVATRYDTVSYTHLTLPTSDLV